MPSSIQISTNTTFLGVSTENDTKEVYIPPANENAGRLIRIKDVTGDVQYRGGLNLFSDGSDRIETLVSSLQFSTLQRPRVYYSNQTYNLPEFGVTKPFQSYSLVSDGQSNWFIKSAYTTPLITKSPDPRDISGLTLWFDPSIIPGSNGQQISTFRNKLFTSSVSASISFLKYEELFQASATNLGPLLQLNGLNNQKTLLFNNSNFNMTLSPTRNYNTYTLFTVSRLLGDVNRRLWQGSNINALYGYWNGFKNVFFQEDWIVAANNTNYNTVTVNSNWDLNTFTCDLNFNAQMYTLGKFVDQGTVRGPFFGLTINLGAINPTEKSTGEIGEWILYNRVLTPSERQRVEGYLAIKYGLQNQLVAGHPYSTFVPSTLSTIANLSNLKMWFDATRATGSNGQPISSLQNLVGTPEFLGSNSGTSTTWATLRLNALNGLPVLQFLTTQRFLVNCNFLYSDFTMMTVSRQLGGTNRRVFQGTAAGINSIFGYNNARKNIMFLTDTVEGTGAASDSNWDLYTFHRQQDGMTSISQFGSNVNRMITSGLFQGLGINTGVDVGLTSDCEFAELLFFNRGLLPGEIQTAESYLATKWGLASNLYVPQIGACNLYVQTAQPLASTISVLPNLSSLKYWFNLDDVNYLTHPYKVSSVVNWSPSTISGLNAWYDASGLDNFSTLINASVATWYDRSGSNRHLVQGIASNQPTWNSNGYVSFDGNAEFLNFTTVPSVVNTSFTIFCVEKRQKSSQNFFIGGTSATTNQNLYVGYNASAQSYFGFQGNDLGGTVEPFNDRYAGSNELTRIWSVQYSPTEGIVGTRTIFINGILLDQGGNVTNLAAWTGASVGNYRASSYYQGFIYELLFYNRFLSVEERQSVEGYLARKWNQQSNLMYFTPVSTLTNKAALGSPLVTNVATVNTGRLSFNTILQKNVMNMNSSNSMQINDLRIYPTYTMFTVSRYTFQVGQPTWYIFQGRLTGALYGYTLNRKNIFTGDGNIEANGIAANSNWDIYRFGLDSNGLGRFASYSSNINVGYIQSGFEGLGINTGSVDTNPVTRSGCEIAEIIVYDQTLSTEETFTIETYLANKYNLQSNLLAPNPNSNFFAPSTISTLSDIPNLKFWFDPTQVVPVPPHRYYTQPSPLTSPSTISNCICWYDASGAENFTLTASSIGQWNDKSGLNNHLVQATQSNRPNYVNNNTVFFNGGSRFLTFTTIPQVIRTDYTIFVVEQRQTSNQTFMMGGATSATNQNLFIGYDSSTSARIDYVNNNLTYAIKPYQSRYYGSNEPYRIWTYQYDGTSTFTRTVYINGFQQAGQTRFNSDIIAYAGAAVGRTLTTIFYNGNIRELILYNRSLSIQEREDVEGYLAWKWNLQPNLSYETPVSTLRNFTQLGADLVSDGSVEGSPILVSSSTLGNQNVMRFLTAATSFSQSAVNKRMTTSENRIYPSEFTMFHISRMMGGLSNSRWIFQTNITANLMQYGYAANRKHYFTSDGNIEINGPGLDSNWNLYRFQRDSNGLAGLWFYGSNINKGYAQSGFEGLGINGGTVDNNQVSDCEVGEIILYDRNLKEEECQRVETYLANKYSLQNAMLVPSPLAPPLIPSTVSTLSHIPGLQSWFDTTQTPILTHPYKTSSVIGFSPSSISFLEGWFDASGIENFSLVGSTIQTWFDKSPKQNPLVQATASNRPDYFETSRNVIFNGLSRFMTFSTIPMVLGTDYTVFCVEKRQTNAAMYWLGGLTNVTNQNFYLGYDATNVIRVDLVNNALTATIDSFQTLDTEPYRIWSMTYGTSNFIRSLYVDGIMYSNQFVAADVLAWAGAGLGRRITTFYNGRIQEFLLYNKFLDTAERQSVEGYLATKWGLQSNLNSFTPISTLRNLTQTGSDLVPVDTTLFNFPQLVYNSTVQQNVARFTISPVRRLQASNPRIYPGAYTLFTVSRLIGGTNRYVFQGPLTSVIYGYSNARKDVFKCDGNQIADPGQPSDVQWTMHRFQVDSNSSAAMFSFGTFLTTGFASCGYEGLSINAGSTDCNSTSDCEVAEVLMYDRLLSPLESKDVEIYLGNKYNLTSALSYFASGPSNISSLSNIGNLALWFDSSQLQGSNFTQVSSMINWVGTGERMLNTGAVATMPRLITGGLNGYNILNFSTTQNLTLTPSRLYTEFTFFTVARQIGGTNRRIFNGALGSFTYGYRESGRKVIYRNETDGVLQLQSALTSDTNWDINSYTRTKEGMISSITWNGTVYLPSTALAIGGFESLSINFNDTAQTSDAQIAEMIVYSAALPQEQNERVEGYLAWKWGLTTYLPDSHPYKNVPP
jgi:hypothetical protein